MLIALFLLFCEDWHQQPKWTKKTFWILCWSCKLITCSWLQNRLKSSNVVYWIVFLGRWNYSKEYRSDNYLLQFPLMLYLNTRNGTQCFHYDMYLQWLVVVFPVINMQLIGYTVQWIVYPNNRQENAFINGIFTIIGKCFFPVAVKCLNKQFS